ncbi:MAG: hypothetical protein WBE06_07335 [Phycisphaerae bacterium]
MASVEVSIPTKDTEVLRGLGRRLREIANDPVNQERRRLWYKHDALQGERPMVLAELSGVLDEVLPDDAMGLECAGPWARGVEHDLRLQIFRFERLADDWAVEPFVNVPWNIAISTYGVEAVQHYAEGERKLGARRWDPALADVDRDFHRLRPRTFSVDRPATLAREAALREVFDGILGVRIRGSYGWTMGMTQIAVDLVGLENLMLLMYDNPRGLHRLMAFLRDDHLAYITWREREGLLTLNNEDDYVGSGTLGYTRALPQPDHAPGDLVRTKDLWCLSESQETTGVGPDQFEEFIFRYQKDLVERFGVSYYGCCEPVHTRWHVIRKLPNLKRVSISPWCDEAMMAEALAGRYVFSRKPHPALVSTERFDEDAIRQDVRRTLSIARGCTVELIMKDVHTLCNQAWRLGRWVELAREVIDEFV